jgi:hypothetical protein
VSCERAGRAFNAKCTGEKFREGPSLRSPLGCKVLLHYALGRLTHIWLQRGAIAYGRPGPARPRSFPPKDCQRPEMGERHDATSVAVSAILARVCRHERVSSGALGRLLEQEATMTRRRLLHCGSTLASYHTVTPCRVLATREASGPTGGAPLSCGTWQSFTVAGNCGGSSSATAVSPNLTGTASTAQGHLRLFPAGAPAPLVSTLNYTAGLTRANSSIATLGTGGGSLSSVPRWARRT